MSKKSREEEEESGEQTAFSFPDNARPRRGGTRFTHIVKKYSGGKTYGNCQGDCQHGDLGVLRFINWWFPKLTWKDTRRVYPSLLLHQHEDDMGFPSRTMAIKAVIWGGGGSELQLGTMGKWRVVVAAFAIVRYSWWFTWWCSTVLVKRKEDSRAKFRGHSWQLFAKKSASGKEARKCIVSRPLSSIEVFCLFVCHKKNSARDGSS